MICMHLWRLIFASLFLGLSVLTACQQGAVVGTDALDTGEIVFPTDVVDCRWDCTCFAQPVINGPFDYTWSQTPTQKCGLTPADTQDFVESCGWIPSYADNWATCNEWCASSCV